ncbi:peptidoglycan/LPS O-acetylase OafA/YrhL [Cryobacterium mesophilum]|uniref:Acyltransferase n=1 Tax=Terrimesophilobacter mesophilus TaxID=433647 RepID=A0A4V3I9K1_9MICO|nr:acyltransferase family protein [Terrimesophilobacter mesophilus]MBB5633044.1 peptidoglycan/LPS O-acetylase OafA/YrhL [Terrimesophilobacter mesophilus]TFB79808.1 acyltransferase [Terrimesophilobacter mesophilus]
MTGNRLRQRPPKATHFLPHVQGLRAIAVMLVVLYHVWPGRLSGGYIGVDIFFVISGFLITGQLARELDRTGRIALPSFWAKRARRLLPAAITVLVFCSLAVLFLLPLSSLVSEAREILASTFYVENWQLAFSSVDYLASHDATTVQHYWSLSLEEQFYIVWPLLLLGATWLGVRFFAAKRWLPMVGVVVAVSVASLAASILYTASNPAEAYFVTWTRFWEFGAGAILALLPKLRPRGAWWPNLIGYAGLAMILGAGWFFNRDTPFPGYTALLPVIGTAMVITTDRAKHWWDVGSVLGGPPQRFVGDISYSLYLWHWPLIIIAPYIPGWGLSGLNRVALIVVCFLLAWLTKKYIEDPVRTWKFFTVRKPRITYAGVIGLMAVSSLVIGAAWVVNHPRYEAAAAELQQIRENPPECFGALAGPDCQNPELAGAIIPSPGFGNADSPGHTECFVQLNESAVKSCHFGSSSPDAPRIALIGDSHAYQYIETLIALADQRGWSLTTYLKGACPWTTAPVSGPSPAFTASCTAWRANLADELASVPGYDVVFTAALAHTPYTVSAANRDAALRDGFVDAWKQAAGAAIVTIVDNPDFEEDPNKCLRNAPASSCTEPRASVLDAVDPLALAGAEGGATVLDFTDKYCDETVCFSVIGGANVYRDQDHLTRTFALTLGSAIGDAIESQLP